MKTFENNQVENWIQENHAAVTAEDKMVDDVRLFANEWEDRRAGKDGSRR